MEISPISPRRRVGSMPALGRSLRSAFAKVLAVATLFAVSACGDYGLYRALPVSAERRGVVVSVYEAAQGKGDFSYTVRNASSECIMMSAVSLPQGNAVFLVGLLHLVDESGRKLDPGFTPQPADSRRHVFFRLQPNEELTRTVNLRAIFGVPHLKGYTASLTVSYTACEHDEPATAPPHQPEPLLTFDELLRDRAQTRSRPDSSPAAAHSGDVMVRRIRFVPRNFIARLVTAVPVGRSTKAEAKRISLEGGVEATTTDSVSAYHLSTIQHPQRYAAAMRW